MAFFCVLAKNNKVLVSLLRIEFLYNTWMDETSYRHPLSEEPFWAIHLILLFFHLNSKQVYFHFWFYKCEIYSLHGNNFYINLTLQGTMELKSLGLLFVFLTLEAALVLSQKYFDMLSSVHSHNLLKISYNNANNNDNEEN